MKATPINWTGLRHAAHVRNVGADAVARGGLVARETFSLQILLAATAQWLFKTKGECDV